jgi:hypothetical protein
MSLSQWPNPDRAILLSLNRTGCTEYLTVGAGVILSCGYWVRRVVRANAHEASLNEARRFTVQGEAIRNRDGEDGQMAWGGVSSVIFGLPSGQEVRCMRRPPPVRRCLDAIPTRRGLT